MTSLFDIHRRVGTRDGVDVVFCHVIVKPSTQSTCTIQTGEHNNI